MAIVLKTAVILTVYFVTATAYEYNYNPPMLNRDVIIPNTSDNTNPRYGHSSIKDYDGDLNDKSLIGTGLTDAKYRTWKRNGDLINFLLGLPVELSDAGR